MYFAVFWDFWAGWAEVLGSCGIVALWHCGNYGVRRVLRGYDEAAIRGSNLFRVGWIVEVAGAEAYNLLW